MSDNRTSINDLSENNVQTGELSDAEIGSIAGGQEESQRLLIIDTIHSSGCVTADAK